MAVQTPRRGLDNESEHSEGPLQIDLASVLHIPSTRASLRRRYVAGVGVAALIVAAGGMTAALVAQPPAQERAPLQAKQIVVTAAGAPGRDQWYLETPAATTAQRLSEQPRDRWYLDLPTAPGASRSAPPARDQWYLDSRN